MNDWVLNELDENGSLPVLNDIIKQSIKGLRISVVDSDGNVIYDTTYDSLPAMSNHLQREEIAEALKYGEGFAVRRHSELTDESYFYSAKRGDKYIVRSAVPYSLSLDTLLAADYTFLRVMLIITAIMCVIGYFATRKVGVHVARLNKFAENAERGERIIDTEPFPHDELGEISNHIVRLYARLQQAVAERDREHRTALHEEREKIRIKRQLTNNINHELKTPVASMQVCLETLMSHPDMSADKRIEFISRCYEANKRLNQLLADVSSITRIEDGGDNIERNNVNLSEIISSVCDEFVIEARDKGIAISNEVGPGIIINGNSSLLASVFRNLLSNALAYSGGNEIDIKRVDGKQGFITLTVADNGVGVSPEHLPRLFERFYRVDKGRSRQIGGTGLGLSIVKNAVQWHGGTITVDNRASGGLIFRIALKK